MLCPEYARPGTLAPECKYAGIITARLGRWIGAGEVNHPLVGCLALHPTPLQVAQTPDLWMIVYTPVPGTDTAARLQRLRSAAPVMGKP